MRVSSLGFLLCVCVLWLAASLVGEEGEKININTATVEELAKLPGVGKVIAGRIVRHREKSGPFRKVDELLVIRGISQARLEKLRPLVTVGEDSPPEEKKPD